MGAITIGGALILSVVQPARREIITNAVIVGRNIFGPMVFFLIQTFQFSLIDEVKLENIFPPLRVPVPLVFGTTSPLLRSPAEEKLRTLSHTINLDQTEHLRLPVPQVVATF